MINADKAVVNESYELFWLDPYATECLVPLARWLGGYGPVQIEPLVDQRLHAIACLDQKVTVGLQL